MIKHMNSPAHKIRCTNIFLFCCSLKEKNKYFKMSSSTKRFVSFEYYFIY